MEKSLAALASEEFLAHLGAAVSAVDASWRYWYVSPTAARIIGRPVQEILGRNAWEIFSGVVGTPEYEACQRAMATRVPERFTWYFDTGHRWYEQQVIPAGDGLIFVVNDCTDRESATTRATALVAIGDALARTMTVADVRDAVALEGLPLLGAVGGGILVADEGRSTMRALGWSGPDPAVAAVWQEYSFTERTPGTEAYLRGEPVVVSDADELRRRYPRVAATIDALGPHTVAAFPLVSAGERLGVLAVLFVPERQLTAPDHQFLSTVAAMTAQALLRARLFDAEKRSIAALQRSLLPRGLPAVPALDVAARYDASDSTTEIGGDWYDVISLPGQGVGLVMGDVEGHDLGAAALMGLVRSAVRAYALDGQPPAVILERTNVFLADLDLGRIVTLVYAQLHPSEFLITTASAGHPPALVAAPDGTVFDVPIDIGPPLGACDGGPLWPETTSTLPEDAALVLFTDGLVERRGEDIDRGIDRIREVLRANRSLPAERLADAVLDARCPGSSDDVAVVAVRLQHQLSDARRERQVTRRLPPTPASVSLARRFVRQLLSDWGLPDEAQREIELVVSELVTNAARHSEDFLEVRLYCPPGLLRVEVSDSSHRMPPSTVEEVDEEATSGRGLVLVDAIADRWGVDSADLGKRVWAEFDL